MEIDRTLFMMTFGRNVGYQGRHPSLCHGVDNCLLYQTGFLHTFR